MRTRALFVSLVAACAGLIVFVFVRFNGAGDGAPGRGVAVGVRKAEGACHDDSADCLPKLTFLDTAGDVATPAALAGKVVVINFWATWCQPCLAEIPDLAAAYRRHKDQGVVMFGVITDAPNDASLAAFAADHGINYPIVRSDDEIQKAFRYPEALPTTFIYDRTGHVRYARPGAVSGRALDKLLGELVAE